MAKQLFTRALGHLAVVLALLAALAWALMAPARAETASQAPSLRIEGSIAAAGADNHIDLSLDTLQQLAHHEIATSTAVTDGVLVFEGVLMRAVMDHVGAHGDTVTARALNGYEIDIPLRDFTDFDVLLAWSVNGKRLMPDDKGPFWIVYPRDQHEVLQDIRYDYRWVWQLDSLQVK